MNDWGPADRAGFAVVAIAGADAVDLDEVVALAGGRLAAQGGWPDAEALLDRVPANGVLLVEAAGVPAELLAAGLDRIAEAVEARGLPLVVAFAPDAIDPVAAALLGLDAVLLCDPTRVERVAALALAGQRSAAPSGSAWRESEAERLRRLNEEVARIAEVLAKLASNGPLGEGGAVGDRRRGYGGEQPDDAPQDPQAIRRVIRARRMRDMFFPAGLFEDPAWDMLLDLYAAELEGLKVSVSSLCIAAAVAPTTALRWITRMTDLGLLQRKPDPADRRRAFMVMSGQARTAMRNYLAAVARAGLPVA